MGWLEYRSGEGWSRLALAYVTLRIVLLYWWHGLQALENVVTHQVAPRWLSMELMAHRLPLGH